MEEIIFVVTLKASVANSDKVGQYRIVEVIIRFPSQNKGFKSSFQSSKSKVCNLTALLHCHLKIFKRLKRFF